MQNHLKLPEFVERFFILLPSLASQHQDPFERFVLYALLCPKGCKLSDFSDELIHYALSASNEVVQDQEAPITRLMFKAYQLKRDWHSIFNLNEAAGRLHFLTWWQTSSHQVIFRKNSYSVTQDEPLTEGVNLIGFAASTLGLGQMFESTQKSLQQAGISVHAVNINDLSINLKYKINIFCLPGMENYRLLYSFGEEIFHGFYNIGYWPWETSAWPKHLDFCFDCCD